MKLTLVGTSLNVSIEDCPRCKASHQGLIGTPFEEMIAGGYTHFLICTNTHKPILIRVLGETDDVFGRALEKLSR